MATSIPPKSIRISEFFRRLRDLPSASSADEALNHIIKVLNGVEDDLTGIPFNPWKWRTDGRMYAPLPDRIKPVSAEPKLIRAEATRHVVYVSINGAIVIKEKTGEMVLDKAGADGNRIRDMSQMQLGHVELNSSKVSLLVLRFQDINEAREFYEAIGLVFVKEQHGNGPIHYSCECEGTLIELYPGDPGKAPPHCQAGATTLGLSVANLDKTLGLITKLGFEVVSPPKQTAWGIRARVMDPGGREIDLAQE